ncbi:MAG: diacylglycerol kinase [Pseudomonadota bacterium]
MSQQEHVKHNPGVNRLYRATLCSMNGLRAAVARESAFRQELLLLMILLPLAFWWGRNPMEWILLVGSCLVVLIVELLNSGIEATVDRIGLERHELSGLAKDYGSAAVAISLVLVILTWTLIGVDRWL